MKDFLVELFHNYANLILFVHVLSAIIWVGGMFTIRYAVHPAMQHIEDPKVRLARTLEILKSFFEVLKYVVLLSLLSAIVLIVGLNFKGGDPYLQTIVYVKEAIWVAMAIVFSIACMRRNRAEKLFISGDLAGTKKYLSTLPSILVPLNIALGLMALYLGGTLRGF
ncbi:MAG: hypothetical protein GQ570_07180 [Helicobacteraceae bacterium]|nr:hypothetical protein [Helicobacteraceae bacterium]